LSEEDDNEADDGDDDVDTTTRTKTTRTTALPADFILIILNGGRRLFKGANNEGWRIPVDLRDGPRASPSPAHLSFKKMFNAAESKAW